MSQCTTTSGPYRCEREAGHDGECECEAPRAKSIEDRVRFLEERARVLEAQVLSLQMSAPRGIPG
jgi:hypothetical protein